MCPNRGMVAGFAIEYRLSQAFATAVWLSGREDSRVGHTNAVAIDHYDERYDYKIWAVTTDRAVVVTAGSAPPRTFEHKLDIELFDGFIDETAARQMLIVEIVTEYAERMKNANLLILEFSSVLSTFRPDERDEPQYRSPSVASSLPVVCSGWLSTDEQHLRRTVQPRTGMTPWIITEPANGPELGAMSPDFGKLVQLEAVTPCSTT